MEKSTEEHKAHRTFWIVVTYRREVCPPVVRDVDGGRKIGMQFVKEFKERQQAEDYATASAKTQQNHAFRIYEATAQYQAEVPKVEVELFGEETS